MYHSDKKAIASDAADNVEVHPLKDEAGDGDAEGSIFHQSELITNRSPPLRIIYQLKLIIRVIPPSRNFRDSELLFGSEFHFLSNHIF